MLAWTTKISRGCNNELDSDSARVLEVVKTFIAKAPTICSAPTIVNSMPMMLIVTPTSIVFLSILAHCILLVGFRKSLRAKRREAQVQKMEAQLQAMPPPANTKFGKLLATDELDCFITLRANTSVTAEIVVRMSWLHQDNQESLRVKADVSLTTGSTFTFGRPSESFARRRCSVRKSSFGGTYVLGTLGATFDVNFNGVA